MKVLWLVNVPLIETLRLMGEKEVTKGGWLEGMSSQLIKNPDIKLYILFPKKSVKMRYYKGEKITYFPFEPITLKDENLIEYNPLFEKIVNKIKPDIIHIHGTEYPHTLSLINTLPQYKNRIVISIQGLVSIYAMHMYNNLPHKVIYSYTLKELIKHSNIYGAKKRFIENEKNEIQALKKVTNVIGRTDWDKACTTQINPQINYYHCYETLREEFYKADKWELNKYKQYSIFVSQGNYSIKGLHNMIAALSIILKTYPNAKLYVGGNNITDISTLIKKLKFSSYGKYLSNLIKQYNLREHIEFLGFLSSEEMCKQYLNSHVYVNCSSIENSPNSLGEAMLLGVPCVSSFVGGVSSMMEHKKEGFLYQADAPYMLAYYIEKIFKDDKLANHFSVLAQKRGQLIFDQHQNCNQLQDIYRNIFNRNEV
ncbi:MAG: hypothetical protein ATN32_04555 [Candidatus Epulonipiscium fishelsonii]|nr:MAG: hypothetical protein ATN32_04555 [Epulopiscium sp. AS2M-Bin002]